MGILRTTEKSSNIRPYWRGLNGSGMNGVCAYFYDAKIFISVPTGTSGNDRIIILDTERDNWSTDWSFGAKQFFEYTDSSGTTKLCFIPQTGTKVCEISENILGDFGTSFNQSYISPLIPVSKTKTDIMNLKEAIVELGRPRGTISFKVLGIGKDNAFTTLATTTISTFTASTGVGADYAGSLIPSSTRSTWVSQVLTLLDSPSVFTQSTTKKAIKTRKKLYSIQFQVSAASADTQFTLLSLQAKGSLIRRRLPSSWTV
jgi:hypothetical protein